MSSHILAEVSRLAKRIGIIHQGRLLQELDVDVLERNRQRRLLLQARDLAAANQALVAAGQPGVVLEDGSIAIEDPRAIEHPDDVNRLLVSAGAAPTRLVVEEEELEHYFLRLVGMDGGYQHA